MCDYDARAQRELRFEFEKQIKQEKVVEVLVVQALRLWKLDDSISLCDVVRRVLNEWRAEQAGQEAICYEQVSLEA